MADHGCYKQISSTDAPILINETCTYCKGKAYKSQKLTLIAGCTVSIIVLCCLFVAIVYTFLTLRYVPLKNVESNTTEYHKDDYDILLPIHPTNDTTTVRNSSVPYDKVITTESTVLVIMLITGYQYLLSKDNTNGKSGSDNDKENKENSNSFNGGRLRKAGYLASQKGTDTRLVSKAQGMNVTTGITIPQDGFYYLYGCLQITCHQRLAHNTTVIHSVRLNSGISNRTIIEKTVDIPPGVGIYQTSNIFVPMRLEEHDTVSMHVSDASCVYNSRKSNIIGVFKA